MHLVCGEALYDVFVKDVKDGSFDSGEVTLRAIAGGSPYNVAIGMGRLGASVALASDVARDELGERLAAQLVQAGVKTDFLRRSVSKTPLAIVATDTAGSPSYSFLGLEEAAFCPLAETIDAAGKQIRGLHLGSIATVLPNSSSALLDLARRLAGRALISLDPNIRRSIVPDAAVWRRAIDALREFAQVIKVSEEDIAALYDNADPVSVCGSWLSARTSLVILTRGAGGASFFSRAAGRQNISAAAVRVVDTVGAGDSFMAALLAALTRDGLYSSEAIASLSPDRLLALGSYCANAAGVTCSRRGPHLPTAMELESLNG